MARRAGGREGHGAMSDLHVRCSRATEAKPLCDYDCPECRGSMYGFPRGKDDAGKYEAFVMRKSQLASDGGFAPLSIPDFLFPFQRMLVEWACRKGRAAILADCGMGKTPCQLVWADNVACHTNGRVLILTPLAVTSQTIREGEKFGIGCGRSVAGELPQGVNIVVTNYERLHHFRPDDFAGVVCDEASILKSFEGTTRAAIVEFMRTRPYRLLCTATAAPNDYVELGNSAEALGRMGVPRWRLSAMAVQGARRGAVLAMGRVVGARYPQTERSRVRGRGVRAASAHGAHAYRSVPSSGGAALRFARDRAC